MFKSIYSNPYLKTLPSMTEFKFVKNCSIKYFVSDPDYESSILFKY